MEVRPLTDEEREYLNGYFGASSYEWPRTLLNLTAELIFLSFIIFSLVSALDHYVVKSLLHIARTESHTEYLIVISVFIAFLVVQKWARLLLEFRREQIAKMRAIRERNQAEVYNLSIRRAAELKEYEDEGVGFFLETEDNGVLFVRGQDLYDYSSDWEDDESELPDRPYGEVFPSTKITLTRESTSGIRLNLISSGEKIDDVMKLSSNNFMKKNKGKNEYYGPEDGSFYEGSLETVLASFSIEMKA